MPDEDQEAADMLADAVDDSGGDGEQSSGERTFTQAELDRIVKQRLSKEREKYGDVNELRRKASEYDKLADSQKTEQEKLTERATAAEKRAMEAELSAMRAEVAAEKGLTLKQAKRLSGSTREELEADADELLETFGGKQDTGQSGPSGRLKPGAAPSAEPEKSAKDIADEISRRRSGGL